MQNSNVQVLNLRVEDVFNAEFVREVIGKKLDKHDSLRNELLLSSTTSTLVRKGIGSFTQKIQADMRLAELTLYTPDELKRAVGLGKKSIRWLEEYLFLLGVVLPDTKSVHGMRADVKDFLSTL